MASVRQLPLVSSCSTDITGLTVTVKLQLDELPLASVAVQVTVVVPTGNVLPEAGEQLTDGLGSQMSEAVAVNVTTLPAWLVQVVVMLFGQVIDGAVVSAAVTVKLQLDWLP